MTDDTTPGDLIGNVREVQNQLREEYGATEAEVIGDDHTEWGRPGNGEGVSSKGRGLEFAADGLTLIDRDQELTITLRWLEGDLPQETGSSRVASAVEMLMTKIDLIESDFPEADVSTYTDGERAQLNLTFGADS